MKSTGYQDKALLFKTAKAVATELKERGEGTAMRIRIPSGVSSVNTAGWKAVVGSLGKNRLRLEIWLDRFTANEQRKFYVSINAKDKRALKRLADGVAKKLRPYRVITDKDLGEGRFVCLTERLKRGEFGLPLFEEYSNGWCFYGFYDLTIRRDNSTINPHLCARVSAFFESVARTLPNAQQEDPDHEVYPRFENRQRVASHIQRERSRLLATERKIQDDHQCQVCGMCFEDVYGKIGAGFAEAHHVVPLSHLNKRVQTSIDDLRTVCANCHRMLHRMEGKHGDMSRLKRMLRKKR